MTSQQSYQSSASCSSCRGWSCMQCVRAVDHAQCSMDCPDCYDTRNLKEQEWIPTAEMLAITSVDRRALDARRGRRFRGGRSHWQEHRIHRLRTRCLG